MLLYHLSYISFYFIRVLKFYNLFRHVLEYVLHCN